MKKKIIPILILALATIAIFGYLFVLPLLELENTTEIQDPPPLPDPIIEKIDSLRDEDWDLDYFTEIEDYITEFYKEKNLTGSPEEDNALVALDMGYMTTLNKAMEDLDNCLNYSSDLKNEITVFLKKYPEGSKEIKKAGSWFITESSVKKLPSKVSKLLSKRYDENSYNDRKNTIKKLKESNHYNKKISRCSTLSSIIRKAEKDLDGFSNVEYTYNKEFKNDLKEYRRSWESLGKVDDYWINHFGDKNYKWYHNQVQKVNRTLKDRKNIVNQIEEMDSKNLLDIVFEKRQAHKDSLDKLNKELEELDNKLTELINEK